MALFKKIKLITDEISRWNVVNGYHRPEWDIIENI